uniref:Alpha-latrotoxin associated low molecular weight protein 2 n=1 Tax=Latrodectus geometricus TaxID=156851 RepID=TXA2_LATGE|nr:RecName: Full=Alpha-latrotoxin associated low molecular weight protein 2; Short=Alpha-latrotoxin-associated LMWP2; AltName: Full=Latrodectin-2; Flags: Precursor [Latrodectus geometricus]AHC13260.1 alpha-latrotoxin associated low molecular weight protein [Latrodectus geometricus]
MLKLICIVFLVTVLTFVVGEDTLDPAEYGCPSDVDMAELTEKNEVCLRCEDFHKEGVAFTLCKTNCFTTEYYKNCVKDLEEAGKETEE